MCSANQVDFVLVVELAHDVFAKGEADSAIIVTPVGHFFVGVRPKQVTKQARVWHVRWPHDVIDGQDFVQLGGQASVHAQDFVIHQCCNGQAVEAVCEDFP